MNLKFLYDIITQHPGMIWFIILGAILGITGTIALITYIFNTFSTKKDFKTLNERFDVAHSATINKIGSLEKEIKDMLKELFELNKQTSYLQGKVEK